MTQNWPSPYTALANCIYLIRVHGAKELTFTITDFQSEKDKDALSYGPGPVVYSPADFIVLDGDLTANGTLPMHITIEGDQAWFAWFTDRNEQFRGFRIEYSSGEFRKHCFGNHSVFKKIVFALIDS